MIMINVLNLVLYTVHCVILIHYDYHTVAILKNHFQAIILCHEDTYNIY